MYVLTPLVTIIAATEEVQPREAGVLATFTLHPVPVEVSYDDRQMGKEKV